MHSIFATVGSLEGSLGGALVPLPDHCAESAVLRFCDIVDQLRDLWPPQTVTPVQIPSKPDANYYKRFARDFTRSYFFKNLLKCLIAAEVFRHHIGERRSFCDLGGGAGAFTVALLKSINASEVELVDYSANQLNLAKSVIKCLGYEALVNFLESDVATFPVKGRDCVASYSLGEAIQNGTEVLKTIEEANSFLLLDTPPFVKAVDTHLKSQGYHTFARYVEFTIKDHLGDLIEGGGGRFSVLFKGSEVPYAGPSWV